MIKISLELEIKFKSLDISIIQQVKTAFPISESVFWKIDGKFHLEVRSEIIILTQLVSTNTKALFKQVNGKSSVSMQLSQLDLFIIPQLVQFFRDILFSGFKEKWVAAHQIQD